jgi:signal transduction histidine kinase
MTTRLDALPVDAPAGPAPVAVTQTDRRERRHSVGTALRLASFHALLLCVVLGLVSLGLLRTFAAQSSAATVRSLVAEMHAYEKATAARPSGQNLTAFTESYLRTRVLPDGQLIAVVLPGGAVVGSAGSRDLLSSPPLRAWSRQSPSTGVQQRIKLDGVSYQLVAAPLRETTGTVGAIVAAADLTRSQSDFSRVRALVIGEALVALLAAVAGGYLLLRRLLRRVGRITATAAGIGRGEIDRRLGDQGTDDEVGQLAATFDEMADRIEAAMTAQRRLLSDVSHQLRTPLTVARGHLEVLERTGADDPREVHETVSLVVDEIDHMRALVERLLMLGRAMEPDFIESVPVDLRSFCADLVEAARVLAARDWGMSPVPDVVVRFDEAKVRGALLNLIDNAVRATSEGDLIAVTVERRADGGVVLSVDDSGPGIPSERRDAVLQRFARPGAADSQGSGLGLAIAATVAEAHGGSLVLDESPYGGLRVSLSLPARVVAVTAEDTLAPEV